MPTLQVNLNEKNTERVDQLSRMTGKTAEQLVNEALEHFAAESEADEHRKFQEWRHALLGIEGMWKDRDDLPDFAELRKTWNRNLWLGE
jgi:hypothetical protein